jgi:tetratricopeptide (TPR) repeat protein
MKLMLSAAAAVLLLAAAAFGQTCVERAVEMRPQLREDIRLQYSRDLEAAARKYAEQPTADNAIWYARRKGYLGHYKDAVEALTIAKDKYSSEARIYRHRGHRYITLRCFDDAIRDFEKAAKLIKGKPDEVEPDGMPNARNIPTSTLQSNIWYHLGLAYYLKGDWKNALRAYKECQKVSKNNDMRVATSYWHYMTLRRMGKKKDAEKLLRQFEGDIEVIENADYLKLIQLNRDEIRAEALLSEIQGDAATLGHASLGYGIGNYFLYNGDREKAMTIFHKITAGTQWASFGFIAAEAELGRSK